MHRADTIISDNNLKKVEKEKIRTALRNCGYPEWALKEGEQRGKKRDTERKEENTETEKPVGYAVLPYVKGLSERLQRIFKKAQDQSPPQSRPYPKAGTSTPKG